MEVKTVTNGQEIETTQQISALTAREQEILGLMLDGLSLKEIASKLGVSYKTVDFHSGNLYRKLDIQSMHELLKLFVNNEIPESIIRTEQNISLPKEFVPAVFEKWQTFKDETSSMNFLIKPKGVYILSGIQNKNDGYAAALGYPDSDTGEAMKSMSMLSFKVLGDGSEYWVMLPTTDTIENHNHYFNKFSTQNGKITTITVNIKNDLVQFCLDGITAEFIQDNIVGIQFNNFIRKPFNLMIWDIKLYP
jgi:DNA-binding CsgD family transcriptional regulator